MGQNLREKEDNRMELKKVLLKAGTSLCAIAMFFAVNAANGMCFWKSYQPKVPVSLLEKDGE